MHSYFQKSSAETKTPAAQTNETDNNNNKKYPSDAIILKIYFIILIININRELKTPAPIASVENRCFFSTQIPL